MKTQGSREHHWWPVGLQKHWTDKLGNVSSIDPKGTVTKKKAINRKIAKKAHGHTVLLNGPWTTNFEADFAKADDSINTVLSSLKNYKAKGGESFWDFLKLMSLLFKRDRKLRDLCRYYKMDPQLTSSLALLTASLLIRLPARRHAYEQVSEWVGLPPDPNVGKMNMRQFYQIASRGIERDAGRGIFFVLIRSPWKEFVYGDGVLDWISDSLAGMHIHGRALLPLTPNLCLYVSTPRVRRGNHNCACFYAAPWIVDSVNEFTQIYSRDQLFFRSQKPTLSEHFRNGQFFAHEVHRDSFFDMLDDAASEGLVDPFNVWRT